MKRRLSSLVALSCAAFMLVPGIASAQATSEIVRLSIQEPKRHSARGGLLDGENWNIEFRITSNDALGFVELIGNAAKVEAMVLSDPDDCLEFDLGHPGFPGPYQTDCGDGVVDEVFIPFRTDRNDRAAENDIDFCDDADTARLDDDPPFGALPGFRNKAYLDALNQTFEQPIGTPLTAIAVGPRTGGQTSGDCYGYGADEDLPGLVVMADVGAARVFDEKFDLLTPAGPGIRRIRNLAGFTSTVTRETVDRLGRSHIVAHMQVERGMLEPLVAFDIFTGLLPPYDGPNFARRVDSGPIEFIPWDTPLIVDTSVSPPTVALTTDVYDQLIATLPESNSVKVRAVLVEGPAPDFIDDMNGDGRFTIADLVLMGHTPISNQAKRTFNIVQQDKREQVGPGFKCPSERVVVGIDLDNVRLENRSYFCADGDGSSRSFTRIPQ